MSVVWLTIRGVVQSYDWGKVGADSLVAELAGEKSNPGRFAELWYGDHPKGPAVVEDGQYPNLRAAIVADGNRWIGACSTSPADSHLPFLFKVLSIDRSAGLSLQVHPRKMDIDRLSKDRPGLLSDGGEKFEMGIARAVVRLFLGIRPSEELQKIISRSSIYREKSNGSVTGDESSLRNFCRNLLDMDDSTGARLVEEIASSLLDAETPELRDCFARLRANYGDSDPGLRLVPLLNFVTLQPGEGIYIQPGTVHAYLEGDLVECMVSSDNVLRAGLTRKEVQKSVVVDSTTWTPMKPKLAAVQPSPLGPLFERYHSDDYPTRFQVDSCEGSSGKLQLPQTGSSSMLVVIGGEATLTAQSEGRIVSSKLGAGSGALFSVSHDEIEVGLDGATAYYISLPEFVPGGESL